MRVVLPVVGAGTPDDPFRVDYPTYNIVRFSRDGTRAVVEIPDECLPPGFALGLQTTDVDGDGIPDPSRIGALRRVAWRRFLDDRYQELAGRFRPVQGM